MNRIYTLLAVNVGRGLLFWVGIGVAFVIVTTPIILVLSPPNRLTAVRVLMVLVAAVMVALVVRMVVRMRQMWVRGREFRRIAREKRR